MVCVCFKFPGFLTEQMSFHAAKGIGKGLLKYMHLEVFLYTKSET